MTARFSFLSLALLSTLIFLVAACSSTPETQPDTTEETPTGDGQTTTDSTTDSTTDETSDSTTDSTVTLQLGTIQIRVTDQPAPDVTAIVVTSSSIEINKASSETESGWTTLVDEETSFDLLAVAGIEEILGSAELEVAVYPQVRMHVESVTVSFTDGTEIQADVPSDVIRVVGPITVEEGETTIATFDFDAGKSLVFTGADRVLFKPVVKLLVRDSSEPFVSEQEQAEVAAPDPTATPAAVDEFFLSIDSPESIEVITTESSILVSGRTRIDAVISVGDTFADVDEDGHFQVTVVLDEGPNIIEVVASIETGEELAEILVVIYTP